MVWQCFTCGRSSRCRDPCPRWPLRTILRCSRTQCLINQPYPNPASYDGSLLGLQWQWLIIFCHQRVFREQGPAVRSVKFALTTVVRCELPLVDVMSNLVAWSRGYVQQSDRGEQEARDRLGTSCAPAVWLENWVSSVDNHLHCGRFPRRPPAHGVTLSDCTNSSKMTNKPHSSYLVFSLFLLTFTLLGNRGLSNFGMSR